VTLHLPGVLCPGGTLIRLILQPLELVYMEQKPQLCRLWDYRTVEKCELHVFPRPLSQGRWALALQLLGRCKRETAYVAEVANPRVVLGIFLPKACTKVEKRKSNNSKHGFSLPSSALSEHHPCLGQS
jgi:hypothetical protein